MMTPTQPAHLRRDSRLLGKALLNLAAPRLILRAVVIVVAIILWLLACRWLLGFGASVRYDGLISLGQQTVDFLARINPYLWWTAVMAATLAAFFIVRAWLQSDVAAGHAKPVDPAVLGELASGLSADSLDVLRWVWRDRAEPLTVGDLIATRREIGSGRVGKLYLAREQETILRDTPAHASAGAATRLARPAAIEPRLGPSE